MTDPKNLPTYTSDEVASILMRGLEHQHDGARISHDELFETAREIGMTTLEIEAAVTAEVRARAERIEQETRRAYAIRRFMQHVVVFVVSNALLAAIDLKLTGGVFFYWVGIAWGAVLGAHAVRALAPIKSLAVIPPASAPPTRIELRGARLKRAEDQAAAEAKRDESAVRRRVSG